MPRARCVALGFLVGLAGCAGTDQRQAIYPPPIGVQDEIRDARYFLGIPSDTAGPATGLYFRNTGSTAASQ